MFLGTAVAPSSPAVTVAASAGKGVPYLFTHHNSPAFRIRIPADLQPCLGKTEYRRSLGRCYASEAKLRALRLATAALEVFSFTREVIQSRQEVIPHEGGLGTTREPTTSRAGSTPRHDDREKTYMAQGETTYEHGYPRAATGRNRPGEEGRAAAWPGKGPHGGTGRGSQGQGGRRSEQASPRQRIRYQPPDALPGDR